MARTCCSLTEISCIKKLFRAEWRCPSRSSGLHSTGPKCGQKKVTRPTDRPTDHPSIRKKYSIYARISPKFLKPTNIFLWISFVKFKVLGNVGSNLHYSHGEIANFLWNQPTFLKGFFLLILMQIPFFCSFLEIFLFQFRFQISAPLLRSDHPL